MAINEDLPDVENETGGDKNMPPEKSWSHDATLNLISLYKEHLTEFKSTTIRNTVVWKNIADKLKLNTFNFTPKQVENKWKNLRKKYIQRKDNMKDTSSGAKALHFEFFDEFEDIFASKPNIEPEVIASSTATDCKSNETVAPPPTKKQKFTVKHFADAMVTTSNNREIQRERRHSENLELQNKAINTYKDMMEKLLEKL